MCFPLGQARPVSTCQAQVRSAGWRRPNWSPASVTAGCARVVHTMPREGRLGEQLELDGGLELRDPCWTETPPARGGSTSTPAFTGAQHVRPNQRPQTPAAPDPAAKFSQPDLNRNTASSHPCLRSGTAASASKANDLVVTIFVELFRPYLRSKGELRLRSNPRARTPAASWWSVAFLSNTDLATSGRVPHMKREESTKRNQEARVPLLKTFTQQVRFALRVEVSVLVKLAVGRRPSL